MEQEYAINPYIQDNLFANEAAYTLCAMKGQVLDVKTALALNRKILETRQQVSSSAITKRAVPVHNASSSAATNKRVVQGFKAPSAVTRAGQISITQVKGLQGKTERRTSCFRKYLTVSDVKDNQSRLTIRHEFVNAEIMPMLYDEEYDRVNTKEGIPVEVFDDTGDSYSMVFTRWGERMYVFKTAWKAFYKDHELRADQEIRLWAFRHSDTDQLCFCVLT